jgi:hypothetical protein
MVDQGDTMHAYAPFAVAVKEPADEPHTFLSIPGLSHEH